MHRKIPTFITLAAIGMLLSRCFETTQQANAFDEDAVERPALEREIEGGNAVEREPLERKLEGGKADWNVFARAVERLFVGEEPEAVEGIMALEDAIIGDVNNPQLQRFLPVLNRVLTIEIHYLRKICNPDAQQLEQIRTAGKSQLLAIGKKLVQNEHNAFRNVDNGARGLLLDALLESTEEVLPAEKYEKYLAELQQRKAARIEGACELMTMHVDHSLSFSVEEYDKVVEVLVKHAQPQWSSNLQTFLYPEYCPLPDSSVLNPVLNERQKKVWQGKSRPNSSISFGWPQNIGIDQLGGGIQLEELDDYSGEDANE